jgi:hypothetical protein
MVAGLGTVVAGFDAAGEFLMGHAVLHKGVVSTNGRMSGQYGWAGALRRRPLPLQAVLLRIALARKDRDGAVVKPF